MESKMLRVNLTLFNAFLLVGFLGVATPRSFGASQQPVRIHKSIEEGQTFVVKGNVHPVVARSLAQDQGEVAGSKIMPKMELHFAMTSAQKADLQQLLVAQQDRRSPQFHKFLTPEEYAARFGMNTADIQKVTVWLETNGFSNVQSSRSRMWVEFKGTAGQVASAFHTSIHNYSMNGEAHFANATEPSLPQALDGMVEGIRGLHNFNPKPHIKLKPHFTSSISGATYVVPDDWATIYDVKALYSSGLDGSPIANSSGNYCGGSPCSIVVVGQSDVNPSDLANFRSAAGLPAKTITTLIPPLDGDPGFQLGDEIESDLDLEWSNAIAKNANVLFVTADGGVQDAWTWAVDNNAAPILSTSYGRCEVQSTQVNSTDITTEESLFAQAVSQGITIVGAAGDAGAADCDTGYPAALGLAVDYPASSAYVTGVGGTEFTVYNTTGPYWGTTNDSLGGSALQYIPEIVWNDTSANSALSAGGGGASIYIAKPSWQSGLTPSDGHRDVPDIALASSTDVDQILICVPFTNTDETVVIPGVSTCTNGFRNTSSNSTYNNTVNTIGGTSAGAPSFAGVLALLVQKEGARLGNINPNIYTIAPISQTAFHDITSGNNIVPCSYQSANCNGGSTAAYGSMGYTAAVGYDQASGWGSIDAANLFDQWSMDIALTSSPTALSITAGTSGTATITVTPVKNFTGAVSFACAVSSALANVTCSVPSTTVTTSGTTTVTITAASTAGTPLWRRFRKLPPIGPGLMLLAIGLALIVFSLRKQQRFLCAWGAAAMLVLMLGAVSCGGGSSSGSTGSTGTTTTGPVAESGTVTVTATSGQIVNSVSIAVSIP